MLFRLNNFMGSLPRLTPRMLPDNAAQVANNCRLDNAALGPVRQTRQEHDFGGPVTSIYKDGAIWLSWNTPVDVAPAPIASDRIYYTGDGPPKMRDTGTVYALALAAPIAAPTIANLSAVNPALEETVLYAYTFVTGFGEESQPSPYTAGLKTSADVTVRVNAFSAAPPSRNITHKRIYRSQTSASGVTDLFYVAEIPVAQTSYDHNLSTTPITTPIATVTFDPPPDALAGLTALPNGMMAAFVGKEIFFSEPYQPHAWPEEYTLAVDFPIIGLAAFGSTLAILTSGTPYIAQGSQPDTMAMEKMDKALPCLSRRGIVDIGYAAYFPSSDGLAMITSTEASIVSRSTFTREQWQLLAPESFVAGKYEGRYLFTYVSSAFDVIDGGDHDDVITDVYDGGTPAAATPGTPIYDFGTPDSAFGEQRLGIMNIGADPFFLQSDLAVPTEMYTDDLTSKLFMVDGGQYAMEWDAAGSPGSTLTWKSKQLVLAQPTNFAALLIQTENPVNDDDMTKVSLIADGVVVHTVTKANTPQRLPSGYRAKTFELEIVSDVTITAVSIASTMREISQA